MPRAMDAKDDRAGAALTDAAWSDVLIAVDRTYAELIEHQERLEAQNRELEALRQFLSSVITSVSDVLIVLDRDGRVDEVNASTCVCTGLPVAALVGRSVADLVREEDRAGLSALIAEIARTRAPGRMELSLVSSREPAPVEAVLSPRLDDRGRIEGLVLTGRPVGELRRAYAQLERSHAEMKAAQAQLVHGEKLASLGRLLAGVAHELNNPISFVYANAHALERYAAKFETYFERVQAGADRDELVRLREELRLDRELRNLREAVQGAREGAERVRDIVEDLRRLSSDGGGEMAAFDLVETARTAAFWIMRGAGHSTVPEIHAEGPVMVLGHTGHIQQVVMNLVQNALDAVSETAAPQIALRIMREEGRGVLDIHDNGPGIDEATAAMIFDPFFTTKPVGKGTGLGLSISLKIAEDHGGRLSYSPASGGGALFRLELPLAGEDA
ncbi:MULTISPECIES: PAS domain-containing sensor histidine kinase [Paracoccus]|uniref:histidine kinase n=2 Tax=Paracoccus TaxID=265 RepID=A0AAE6NRK3_PARPN|nr:MULTISPECIES: ATP-binding protein [Paracoccus]QFG34780.1 PAS domain-containing protein [Paracoccus pantotrophus]RKS43646.1 two-component system sensor histidine kinase HupT/HoxJ [Paracoccus pantotrophus]UFM65923.1 PAS domain-containing protein [Paracoccus sp. MA]GLK63804.1 PAS domain-containing sensor histidine kinase [Paracoccus kondratievae]